MSGVTRFSPIMLVCLFGVLVSVFASSLKNTYQVFFVQMAEDFALSHGAFAVSGSLFMLTVGVSSPVVGYIADRFGAKRTIFVGVLFAGLLYFAMAVASSFPVFVLLYGVGAALAYTALSYVPLGILIDDIASPRIKSVIYAIVTNGAAVGFMVLSPFWIYSETITSWRTVFIGLGLFFLLPVAILCVVTLRSKTISTENVLQHLVEAPMRFGDKMRRVFSNGNLYILALGFMGCGFTMALIDIHIVAHGKDIGLHRAVIGSAISVLGVTEFAGAIVAGYLCDRYDKVKVLIGCYLLRGISVACLLVFPNGQGTLVFAALFGASFMGTVIATSMLTLDMFGKQVRGFAFGIIWLAHQIGAFMSAQGGAQLRDAYGDYEITLQITALVAITAAVISTRLSRATLATALQH